MTTLKDVALMDLMWNDYDSLSSRIPELPHAESFILWFPS